MRTDEFMVEDPNPENSAIATRRRPETLWSVIRSFSRLWGFGLFLVAIVLLFRGVVLPFVFGLLIAYLLAPIVAIMQPKIGRVLAVVVCYLVLSGFLSAFFGLLLPAVTRDFAKLRGAVPVALERFNADWLPRAEAWVDREFGDLISPAPDDRLQPQLPRSELVLEPLGDGRFRVQLQGLELMARQHDEGTWIIGPPPRTPEDSSADLGDGLRAFVAGEASNVIKALGPAVQAVISSVAHFLTNFVITFMIAAFVLVDLSRINRFVRALVPFDYRESFDELWASMDRGLSGVIRGQLIICLVNGALTLVGLLIFQIKYAFLLAMMAAALSMIPIFGTIVSSVPIIVVAAVSGADGFDPYSGLLMLGWLTLIHLLEANILNPKIIGDSAHIHPVIVIFALLAGEHVLGLTGALLAIPVVSIVQALFLHARRRSSVFSRDSEFV